MKKHVPLHGMFSIEWANQQFSLSNFSTKGGSYMHECLFHSLWHFNRGPHLNPTQYLHHSKLNSCILESTKIGMSSTQAWQYTTETHKHSNHTLLVHTEKRDESPFLILSIAHQKDLGFLQFLSSVCYHYFMEFGHLFSIGMDLRLVDVHHSRKGHVCRWRCARLWWILRKRPWKHVILKMVYLILCIDVCTSVKKNFDHIHSSLHCSKHQRNPAMLQFKKKWITQIQTHAQQAT